MPEVFGRNGQPRVDKGDPVASAPEARDVPSRPWLKPSKQPGATELLHLLSSEPTTCSKIQRARDSQLHVVCANERKRTYQVLTATTTSGAGCGHSQGTQCE